MEERYNYVFEQYDGDEFIFDLKEDEKIYDLSQCAHILNKYEAKLVEERKKVVQEIRDWCDKNFNWVGDGTGFDGQDYNEMIGSNNTINKLREKLDQIERGEKDANKTRE